MPKPAGLVSLFWGNAGVNIPKNDVSTAVDLVTCEMGCQTDIEEIVPGDHSTLANESDWNHEVCDIEVFRLKIYALLKFFFRCLFN